MFNFIRKEVRWSSSVPLELAGEGRYVIPRNEFVPAYLKTYEEGRLCEKIAEALELLRSCHVCPRDFHWVDAAQRSRKVAVGPEVIG